MLSEQRNILDYSCSRMGLCKVLGGSVEWGLKSPVYVLPYMPAHRIPTVVWEAPGQAVSTVTRIQVWYRDTTPTLLRRGLVWVPGRILSGWEEQDGRISSRVAQAQ